MATTRDVATKPKLTWFDAQKPNTLMMFLGTELLVLDEKRLIENQNRHNRRGGVPTYLEAVELRLYAWPNPGEPQVLLEKRNTAAMDMLDLAFRLYSR